MTTWFHFRSQDSLKLQLTWVVAGAMLIRLLWGLAIPVVPVSDSHAYDVFARTLLEHQTFGWTADEPFAFWPPGTSFLYAAVYAIFGTGYGGIVALNIALTIVIILCSARVAQRWFGNEVALATALVLAVWPTLVQFTTILASELPYLAFTIAALDVWTQRHRSVPIRGLLAGLLLGMAALVRSQALALPIIFALGLWVWGDDNRETRWTQFKLAAIACVMIGLIVAPWTLRNYRLYGAPVVISTNGGIVFWMGNTPGSKGDYEPIPQRLQHLNDYEQSKVLASEARQFIMSDPIGFASRTAKKFVYMFSNESIGVHWNIIGIRSMMGEWAVQALKRFSQITWAMVFLLGALGTCILWKRLGWWTAARSPLVLTIGFYVIIHSLMVSQDRYHLAFATQWAMLAGCGIAWILQVRRRWARR